MLRNQEEQPNAACNHLEHLSDSPLSSVLPFGAAVGVHRILASILAILARTEPLLHWHHETIEYMQNSYKLSSVIFAVLGFTNVGSDGPAWNLFV